jgi:hypothetical protein
VPRGESSNSGLFEPEKEMYHRAFHRIFGFHLNNFIRKIIFMANK